MPDVLKRSVALEHPAVLGIRGPLLADEVAVHDAGPPHDLRRLLRGLLRLHHNPQQRRPNQPQRLPQPVEVIRLHRPVVRRGDDDQELPRIRLDGGGDVLLGIELDGDERIGNGDEGGEIAPNGRATLIVEVEGEVVGAEAGVVEVGEGEAAEQGAGDEAENEREETPPPRRLLMGMLVVLLPAARRRQLHGGGGWGEGTADRGHESRIKN